MSEYCKGCVKKDTDHPACLICVDGNQRLVRSELDKIAEVQEKSQAIGEFLDWLFGKGMHLARYLTDEEYDSDDNKVDEPWEEGGTYRPHIIRKGELIPIHIDIGKLLAEFFEIDLSKVEEERSALLASLRKGEEER